MRLGKGQLREGPSSFCGQFNLLTAMKMFDARRNFILCEMLAHLCRSLDTRRSLVSLLAEHVSYVCGI